MMQNLKGQKDSIFKFSDFKTFLDDSKEIKVIDVKIQLLNMDEIFERAEHLNEK